MTKESSSFWLDLATECRNIKIRKLFSNEKNPSKMLVQVRITSAHKRQGSDGDVDRDQAAGLNLADRPKHP